MDYRFEISKPDSSDFRCEIAISGDQTFQEFHDKIVETLGFDGSQMASFFALDKEGNRGREIALMEMSDEDNDENSALVMDVTMIREVVNASCIELDYVYDFFSNSYLRVEYAGAYSGDSADVLPLCVYCEGKKPRQSSLESREDDWKISRIDDEEDYDDSFLEEFGEERHGYGRKRYRKEYDEFGFEEEEDGFGGEFAGGEEEDGLDDRYESLDDYIDKL